MKSWLQMIMAALAVMGCEQSQTVGDCGAMEETDTSQVPYMPEPIDECEPTELVETTLPTSSMGTMIAICSDCDVGKCIELGEPCGEYGSACDADGLQGVCVACCNGTVGELHCKPVK